MHIPINFTSLKYADEDPILFFITYQYVLWRKVSIQNFKITFTYKTWHKFFANNDGKQLYGCYYLPIFMPKIDKVHIQCTKSIALISFLRLLLVPYWQLKRHDSKVFECNFRCIWGYGNLLDDKLCITCKTMKPWLVSNIRQ